LAAKIQKSYPGTDVDLIKGGKGAFIVTVDGKQIWNKREMDDEFPDEAKLVGEMKGKEQR
jgi:selT/selW/selH-like putative selenoprotein